MIFIRISIVLSILTSVIHYKNYAQSKGIYGFKETIEYLNQKFDGHTTFKYKKNLTIEFVEKGMLDHIDNVDIRDLDTNNVVVNYEKKNIKISCQEPYGDCVTRILKLENTKRRYPRIIIDCSMLDEKSFEGVHKALVHLLKLAQIDDYISDEPFE